MSAKSRTRPRRPFHPRLELLEARLAPATFDVISIGSLLSAVQQADRNGAASNTIVLAPGTYTLKGATPGEILIQNQAATSETLTIEGGTQQNTILTGGANWKDRIFEINGGQYLTVNFQNLTISGGNVTNPTGAAKGGGLLIDSGNVTLKNVAVSGNKAVGTGGMAGAKGATGQNGGPGGPGGDAEGGGIYLASGSLTLTKATVSGNSATGGKGGAGGAGGSQLTSYAPTPNFPVMGNNGANGTAGIYPSGLGGNAGNGGDGQDGAQPSSLKKNTTGGQGGDGGDASGGGIYVASGQLTIISNSTISKNTVQGGAGGAGGAPGRHISNRSGHVFFASAGLAGQMGGGGGNGGNGGAADHTGGRGGNGGVGGAGGKGGNGGDGADGGKGGKGGDGGTAQGGGVYLASGTLTVVSTNLTSNTATGG
jgi:hypothetical protein